VHAGSTRANNLGQMVFALYMAVATRTRWRRWTTALCVLPWAGFMLWSAAPTIWQVCRLTERFSATPSSGDWVIRLALALLLLLLGMQALLDLREPTPARP
jgi:hypothetical protein